MKKQAGSYKREMTDYGFRLMVCWLMAVSIIFVCIGCNPEKATSYSYQELAEHYRQNVVEIRSGISSGTGVILGKSASGDPIIATNYHVAIERDLRVKFLGENDFTEPECAQVLGYDEELDIFLFQTSARPKGGFKDLAAEKDSCGALVFQSNTPINAGEEVLLFGNAGGAGISVFEGIISSPERVVQTVTVSSDGKNARRCFPLLQTTVSMAEGCSGGPLFDRRGRLVGIGGYRTDAEGALINYAISAELLYQVYRDVKNNALEAPMQKLRIGFSATQDAVSVNFVVLGIKAAMTGEGLMISGHQSYEGFHIKQAGRYRIDALSYTQLLRETLCYSLKGTGEEFSLHLERNGKEEIVFFSEYRLKI